MKSSTKKLMAAALVGAFALATVGLVFAQGARTKVVWYIGLGTGASAQQVPVQKAAVERFNKSQDKIELVMEVVDNNVAADQLAARIAAGNAPDFVGPVGGDGYAKFRGQFADLTPLIAKFKPDTSGMDDALLKFYSAGSVREGLPYAVYPSFIFYNKDLFDEAGLPYPPAKFGERYQGRTWDWNTLRQIAMKMTIDANGKDATESGFDAKKIVQFGFVNQWNTGATAMATTFGAASLTNAQGRAQIPANWINAWKWYQNGIWKDRFMPNQEEMGQEVFGSGNNFNSGKFAMAYTHLWYQCCLDGGANAKVKNWGVAVVPSYNGKYTAKLHADTFRIMRSSKNQDAAFQAMWWLMQQPDLLRTYGAFPADERLQDDFISEINKKYAQNAKINWQTVKDSLKYVDVPSHEQWMPNYLKSFDILTKFANRIFAEPNMNINAEASKLRVDLQNSFNQAR